MDHGRVACKISEGGSSNICISWNWISWLLQQEVLAGDQSSLCELPCVYCKGSCMLNGILYLTMVFTCNLPFEMPKYLLCQSLSCSLMSDVLELDGYFADLVCFYFRRVSIDHCYIIVTQCSETLCLSLTWCMLPKVLIPWLYHKGIQTIESTLFCPTPMVSVV